MTALLQAENISVERGGRRIVADASLILRGGEWLALVGRNGAGKTTLLRALAGLIPADGAIRLDGRPLRDFSARRRAQTIAYLPQGHSFHWPVPVETAVLLGRMPHGDPFARPTPADRDAVHRAMARTGADALAGRVVTTLSGGERARVALARVLATEAPILLADEPTLSLDPRAQLVVMEILAETARAGTAALTVLHDLTLAARFADRALVMQDGRIVADGAPVESLSDAMLAAAFGVEARRIESLPLPWRPL